MYRISATGGFYNGMTFGSLGEAYRRIKAIRAANPYSCFDLVRDIDGERTRVVSASPGFIPPTTVYHRYVCRPDASRRVTRRTIRRLVASILRGAK